jgi:hypothetical protein
MVKVFISYRREDSRDVTDRICDRLASHLGKENIFKDVDSIPLGTDFRRVLEKAIDECDMLLVVIGNRWLQLSDEADRRRLDYDDDFVRIEIERALARDIAVVPLLVNGATMPRPSDLPVSIQQFAFRHASPIRPDPDFHRDVDRLLRSLGLDIAQNNIPRETSDNSVSGGHATQSRTATGSIEPRLVGLSVRTQRTQYANFLLINPMTCQLPEVVPSYSFVHSESGLVANSPSPSTIGVEPEDYEGTLPPHIPDGEMIVDFTVLNEGSTALVTRVELEVLDVLDVPIQSCPGNFWPILEPIEDSAVITRGESKYPLFKDRTLAYRDGEVDLLRVNVRVSDDATPSVFGFRFNVHYTTRSGSERTAQSDTYYVAKSNHGPTLRIPYEKAPSSQPPTSQELRRVNPIDREDLWTDGRYYNHLLAFSRCDNSPKQDDYKHLRSSFWNAVMSGKRDEIQENGFKRLPWDGQPGGAFQEVFVPVNPSQGRGYSSHGHPDVHIYDRRDTKEYDCLLLACKRLADTGPADRQRLACEFLIDKLRWPDVIYTNPLLAFFRNVMIDKIRSPKLDVAGVIDTIPLLAFFRNELSCDCLVDFLSVEHEVVLANVAYVFNSVRYRKSANSLLAIVKADRSYATLPALGALRLNGHPSFASEIIDACDGLRLRKDDADVVAEVLVSIAREEAKEFASRNSGNDVLVRRLVAFHILKLLKV